MYAWFAGRCFHNPVLLYVLMFGWRGIDAQSIV